MIRRGSCGGGRAFEGTVGGVWAGCATRHWDAACAPAPTGVGARGIDRESALRPENVARQDSRSIPALCGTVKPLPAESSRCTLNVVSPLENIVEDLKDTGDRKSTHLNSSHLGIS